MGAARRRGTRAERIAQAQQRNRRRWRLSGRPRAHSEQQAQVDPPSVPRRSGRIHPLLLALLPFAFTNQPTDED
jgi:hypothetical protein